MDEYITPHVDIFIPHHFYENSPTYVFGLCHNYCRKESVLNCTVCSHYLSAESLQYFVKLAQHFNKKSLQRKRNFTVCIGVLTTESQVNPLFQLLKDLKCPTFIVELSDERKFTFVNWKQTNRSASIITYDSHSIYNSSLLANNQHMTFIDILFESWSTTKDIFNCHQIQIKDKEEKIVFCNHVPESSSFQSKLLSFFVVFLSIICRVCDTIIERTPELLKQFFMLIAIGKQLGCKLHHLKSILHDISQQRRLTLLSGNVVLALLLDAACGLLITCCFQDYLQPVTFVEAVIDKTDFVVSHLQKLLYWLMGVPAGLKLNLPLNSALGRFFLYHIYLWKTYIVLIKPLLLVMLKFSMNFGVLGFSFLISLCTDFISLATLHIYCFYGYAARIYSLKISGLIAFWRLFRGKKWNPLRNRVDSFTYDVQQLFIGTLIFTVMIFLMPTVILYYAVFSVLRLLVLFLQIILCKVIDILTAFPLYVILLYISGHPSVKGDIRLRVVSATEGTVSLSLKVISIPLMQVLQQTLPAQHLSVNMKFKEFVNNLIFGKVI